MVNQLPSDGTGNRLLTAKNRPVQRDPKAQKAKRGGCKAATALSNSAFPIDA
jgi:hypothetical protein